MEVRPLIFILSTRAFVFLDVCDFLQDWQQEDVCIEKLMRSKILQFM